jgi:hypothetical protein
MHRTQVLLERWQYEELRAKAERQGRSLGEIVRETVAEYLTPSPTDARRALHAIEGIGTDGTGAGRAHDRYLSGRPRRRGR